MIADVSVVPKSPCFAIRKKDGKVRVYLKSPPEGNKANLELVKEFEKLFGRPVSIVSGAKSKNKKLGIPVKKEEWERFLSGI